MITVELDSRGLEMLAGVASIQLNTCKDAHIGKVLCDELFLGEGTAGKPCSMRRTINGKLESLATAADVLETLRRAYRLTRVDLTPASKARPIQAALSKARDDYLRVATTAVGIPSRNGDSRAVDKAVKAWLA